MSGLALAEIGVNDLPRVWSAILPLIERACEHTDDELTPQIVADGVYHGAMQMLCLHDGGQAHSIMVTMAVKPANAPSARLEVLAVGGRDMALWKPFESDLDAIARRMGCDRLRAKTRKGMAKALPDWELKAYVMERVI